MLVPIDRLRADSTPVRRRLWEADDASLRASIAELGVLQPLLVVRLGDDMDDPATYEVKDGNRRLAAARAAGLLALEVSELPRRREDFTLAAATAGNLVRAPLDPLDQWRAIVQLQERGYDLVNAGRCLGLSERAAHQLDKLGRLHPDMLSLIERYGVPTERTLGLLALTPLDLQARVAMDKGVLIRRHDDKVDVNWHQVVQLCHRTRYPRTAAIFDLEAAGIAWDRDWLAQPGSAEEWTTADAPSFMKAQRAALEAEAAASKGRLVVVEEHKTNLGTPALPKGWVASYGKADKPKRNETVYACVSTRTGDIVRSTATNPAAEKAKQNQADTKAKAKAKAKAEPAPIPSAVGAVATPLSPAGTLPTDAGNDAHLAANKAAREREQEQEEGDEPDLGDTGHPATGPKPPMTKEGQKLLAQFKTQALRARLRDRTQPLSNDVLVPLLVLALHAKNVEIRGYQTDGGYSRDKGEDLLRRLITPAGLLQYDGAELPAIAGEALARTLSFSAPDGSTYLPGSGDVAEWIAAAIDAQPFVPPIDSTEFIATLSAEALRSAAAEAGQKFTTATAAKRDLPGKLPSWTPNFAHYGAPGPKPAKEG
jgi:ParB family chromosome partitioning protein